MSFVDGLHQLGKNENERIEATCKYYELKIINQIHNIAIDASRKKLNRITGYLLNNDSVTSNLASVSYNLSSDDDPIDFKYVFTDLTFKRFSEDNPLVLSKEMIEEKVLKNVEAQLHTDGFQDFTLRCERVEGSASPKKYGHTRSESKSISAAGYRLYIFVDITW